MEPSNLFNPQQSIWKILPLHPQPQPLESFTSYIMRLAEANGLKSINELAMLASARWFRIRTFPDYPCPSYEGLAQIARCTETQLEGMTILPFAQYFGCSLHTRSLREFFQNILATNLRYCPYCLAEQSFPYYRLLWRFLAVQGCIHHNCMLLCQCGYCGKELPLVTLVPQLARCPSCKGDLRICQAPSLTVKAAQSAYMRTGDFKYVV